MGVHTHGGVGDGDASKITIFISRHNYYYYKLTALDLRTKCFLGLAK